MKILGLNDNLYEKSHVCLSNGHIYRIILFIFALSCFSINCFSKDKKLCKYVTITGQKENNDYWVNATILIGSKKASSYPVMVIRGTFLNGNSDYAELSGFDRSFLYGGALSYNINDDNSISLILKKGGILAMNVKNVNYKNSYNEPYMDRVNSILEDEYKIDLVFQKDGNYELSGSKVIKVQNVEYNGELNIFDKIFDKLSNNKKDISKRECQYKFSYGSSIGAEMFCILIELKNGIYADSNDNFCNSWKITCPNGDYIDYPNGYVNINLTDGNIKIKTTDLYKKNGLDLWNNVKFSFTNSDEYIGGLKEADFYSVFGSQLSSKSFAFKTGKYNYAKGGVDEYRDGINITQMNNVSEEELAISQKNDAKYKTNSNGHEYVDLGLSVLWATKNIGASSIENYGAMFRFGEKSPSDPNYYYPRLKKEVVKKDADGFEKKEIEEINSIGGTEYDAAHLMWEGDWRMPTRAELIELSEKCNFYELSKDSVLGYKVVSKINGNWIFIPFTYKAIDRMEIPKQRADFWTADGIRMSLRNTTSDDWRLNTYYDCSWQAQWYIRPVISKGGASAEKWLEQKEKAEQQKIDDREKAWKKAHPGLCYNCLGGGVCSYCNGDGDSHIVHSNGVHEPCPFCGGSGFCGTCHGSGRKR